ncbi:MAG: hypothetical protein EZS28_014942 [Streblomastix strix]|uniref:Uncharacterized protein n=1 Tax=Streblomastix strix TaxID=222440 RepID=A0A5J4W4C9_9EUKA|nr:MAG: hypothetical protein EZS28_014942 [Streblomastix strix]
MRNLYIRCFGALFIFLKQPIVPHLLYINKTGAPSIILCEVHSTSLRTQVGGSTNDVYFCVKFEFVNDNDPNLSSQYIVAAYAGGESVFVNDTLSKLLSVIIILHADAYIVLLVQFSYRSRYLIATEVSSIYHPPNKVSIPPYDPESEAYQSPIFLISSLTLITQTNQILDVNLFVNTVSLIPAPYKLKDRASIINPSSSQVPDPIQYVNNVYTHHVFQLIAYVIEYIVHFPNIHQMNKI